MLDWKTFAVFLSRSDVADLPAALARHDWRALHANVLKVRRLFAYFVDAPGRGAATPWGPADALPLVVFEMWRRTRRPDALHDATRRPDEADALAAARGDVSEADRAGRAPPVRAGLRFSCAPDGESCAYELHGERWNCSARSPMACGCVRVGPR